MTKFKKILNIIKEFYFGLARRIANFFIMILDDFGLGLMLGLVVIISIVVRYTFISFSSGDTYWYLVPWTRFIRDNGGLASLNQIPISFYRIVSGSSTINMPYGSDITGLTISSTLYGNYPTFYYFIIALFSYLPVSELAVIKIISFIFDFIMALAVYFIVKKLTRNNKILLTVSFALALLLPTVLINSAVWGQSDAVYGGLALWFIYFIITDRPKLSMVMIGIALAIKIQIFFILPIVGILFLRKKFKLTHLLIIPLIVFLSFIPAYIAGAPFKMPINQLTSVAGTYNNPNMNSGSIYALFGRINLNNTNGQTFINAVGTFGVPLAFSILLIVIYVIYEKKVAMTPLSILAIGTLFAMLSPFVLPYMHERYFYMGDVFILVYVVVFKKKWHLLLLSQAASLLTYANFILGGWIFPSLEKGNLVIAMVLNIVIIGFLLRDVLTMPKLTDEGPLFELADTLPLDSTQL